MKVFFVYILYSRTKDRFYIGQTDNLEERLISHNSGKSTYTSRVSDWEIVYVEEFETRTLSRKRENEIKRKKSRSYIEWLVGSASSRPLSG
ncbi:MAG: GIY-YIG nuclease family protein [Bacteroidia bacterium]|uniref:GIY-YIG nuclease family protein n=1 Tax=Flavobacterium sp. TaxID=239 RepID=UPI0025C167F1|nr:GIY-YIG nuclease family protein [Flavobacterium sp.]MCK6609242.1 GIY-YIG nuclease family protein [Flavobacterium sp.]MCK6649777.1 GIY-YIG nuclease family protein [Bacteroidia bacterium]